MSVQWDILCYKVWRMSASNGPHLQVVLQKKYFNIIGHWDFNTWLTDLGSFSDDFHILGHSDLWPMNKKLCRDQVLDESNKWYYDGKGCRCLTFNFAGVVHYYHSMNRICYMYILILMQKNNSIMHTFS